MSKVPTALVSKVPADANRAVVYLEGERVADTKTPKPTRGDVVRGKYGNGRFRIDYLEGKFSVGSEMVVVDLAIEEYRPIEKPAPEPVLPPTPIEPEPESIGQSIQRAIDAKVSELHARCVEFRSAIDLYEHAEQQAIRTRAALHNGLTRPENNYRDGDEIEAARLLLELAQVLPSTPKPTPVAPTTLVEVAQRLGGAASEPKTADPVRLTTEDIARSQNEQAERTHDGIAKLDARSLTPKPEVVAKTERQAAPAGFAEKLAEVALPASCPTLRKRLRSAGRSVLIIGGTLEPNRRQEVAEMLDLPIERVAWPATSERSNHAAIAAEASVKNGKYEAVFVLDQLLGHESVKSLQTACTARGIPLEKIGKGGTGRLKLAISHIETLLENREATR